LLSKSVHKSEVNWSSPAIEKLGLQRGLHELIEQGVQIDGVVIDQNSSTIKILETEFPYITIHHDY
jgi:hypothetical protein